MSLPARVFRHGAKRDGEEWTEWLVWDPRVDDYDTARRRMTERQKDNDEQRVVSSPSMDFRAWF